MEKQILKITGSQVAVLADSAECTEETEGSDIAESAEDVDGEPCSDPGLSWRKRVMGLVRRTKSSTSLPIVSTCCCIWLLSITPLVSLVYDSVLFFLCQPP